MWWYVFSDSESQMYFFIDVRSTLLRGKVLFPWKSGPSDVTHLGSLSLSAHGGTFLYRSLRDGTLDLRTSEHSTPLPLLRIFPDQIKLEYFTGIGLWIHDFVCLIRCVDVLESPDRVVSKDRVSVMSGFVRPSSVERHGESFGPTPSEGTSTPPPFPFYAYRMTENSEGGSHCM